MQYNYPHTIENGAGEQLTFVNQVKDETGDYLQVENIVQPKAGPPMHVHFKQEESIIVVKGKHAAQVYDPLTLFFGKLQGKHKKFKDAPEPI